MTDVIGWLQFVEDMVKRTEGRYELLEMDAHTQSLVNQGMGAAIQSLEMALRGKLGLPLPCRSCTTSNFQYLEALLKILRD